MRSTDSERRGPRFGRRQVLGTVGAGLVAVSSAGCLSSLPTMGQQVRYADVDVPDPDEPNYRAWIPARFPNGDAVPQIEYLAPREVFADDGFATGTHYTVASVVVSYFEYLGVGYRKYDELLFLGDAVVGVGAFDAARVRETVLGTGYERAGEYEGYELFERPESGRTVAARDGTVVFSTGELADHGRETVESIVDASDGRRDRLHEVDDEFAALTRELGAMPAMSFWRGTVTGGNPMGVDVFEGHDPPWSAYCFTADDEYAYEVTRVRLEEDAEFSEQRLKTQLEDRNEWYRTHTAEVAVDGTTVAVAGQWTREEAREWNDGELQSPPPQTTWEIEVEDDGETVRIAHLAGDPIDAAHLELTYSVDAPAPEPQFDDEFETVEPGDELTIDAIGRPASLRIVYEPHERRLLTLESHQLDRPE